ATTAIAFADLAARGAQVGVIEVGLGGRLDATNVITPLVSVVTKIAREHTDYLGTDLASIAREKAGVAKREVPFVTGDGDRAGRFDVRRPWIFYVAHNPDGARVLADTLREYNPPPPRRALVGVLGDKDYLGMIECLAPAVDGFVFTMPDTAPERRRWDLGRLEESSGASPV